MPARKIPRNHRVIVGRQALVRLERTVAFESLLERDFIVLMDFDRDVDAVEGQPLRLEWKDREGRVHLYTPDFLVTFKKGHDQLPPHHPGKSKPWLVEVKSEAELRKRWRELRPRFKAAVKLAQERGWVFHLLTERRIRTVRLENARKLLPFMKVPWDEYRCDALMRALEDATELSASELIASVCKTPINQAMLLPMLWSLVAWRCIGADLSLPITVRSPLWFPDWAQSRSHRPPLD